MPETDHYATLGLGRRCTQEEIRVAYRVLSRQSHPDLNPGDAAALARTQEINAAYEVLRDPVARAAHDRDLAERDTGGVRASGRGRTSAGARKVLRQDGYLAVEDFLRGARLDVTVKDPANPFGVEVYSLEVPPDTAPGSRFRIERDEPFAGQVVEVRVRARPGGRLAVRGSDLRTDLRLSFERVARGGTESVAGVGGRSVQVEIPAAVASGTVLRVRGQGLPKAHGGRGDLLVRVTYRPEVRVTRR